MAEKHTLKHMETYKTNFYVQIVNPTFNRKMHQWHSNSTPIDDYSKSKIG